MSKSKEDLTRVVAIGASAGGLEALQEFFKNMPIDSGLSFVIIQHLSPDYKSLMDELLARQTVMDITIIEDGIKLVPNHVYLIPPRKNLKILKDQLFLEDQDMHRGLNLPIDLFFRSLAEDRGKDAIGIILSGTGSDGTMGTKAIKEVGGMIMAQDEKSAKFSGMPANSISTGLVDYVLPPAKMPEELLDYLKHPFVKKNKSLGTYEFKHADNLSKAILILREYTGIDFSNYKENTIIRRLERRVSINRFQEIDQYISFLQVSDKEKEVLSREVLIGVTQFFRDPDAFSSLREKVIKSLMTNKKKVIRVWSAGCSTGEEVYSLAILLQEMKHLLNLDIQIKIFATDVDKSAIDIASLGIYPESGVADLDPEYFTKYFHKVENGYKVVEDIRNMIVFATHNILKDPPFSKLDLLVCRNLFIYLKPDVQSRILSMFYYSLNSQGFLFLGSSETLGGLSEAFDIIDSKYKIYKYSENYSPVKGMEIPALEFRRDKMPTQTISRNSFKSDIKIDTVLDAVIAEMIPPSIIVDSNFSIVSVLNDVNKFTQIQSGRYNNELFSILPKEIGLLLHNMLRQMKKSEERLMLKSYKSGKNSIKELWLEVRKVLIRDKTHFIVSFKSKTELENSENSPLPGVELSSKDTYSDDKILDLEIELQAVKENLNATVEELETSNEELQSSNEELIASNEELQSTNEELQSVNEELYTVNSEYQSKIEELTNLNNDINNLLKNIEVGAIYLDSKLNIRKLTPEIYTISNLRKNDIGRPIAHISIMEFYPDLLSDVNTVMETLQAIDKEINDYDGKSYFSRIRPYRTESNSVEGVLITIVNISELKKMKDQYHLVSSRLDDALHIGKIAWWEYVPTGDTFYFDSGLPKMLGYRIAEFPRNLESLLEKVHSDDRKLFKENIKKLSASKQADISISIRLLNKNQNYSWFHLEGTVSSKASDGVPQKLTGSLIDVSKIISLSEDLEKNKKLLSLVLENAPMATTMVDEKGEITYVNKMGAEVLGFSKEDIIKRTFNSKKWKITDLGGKSIPKSKLPFSIIKKEKRTLLNYEHFIVAEDGERKHLSIDGSPVWSEENRFIGVVFTIREL
ncbi:MAG: chemotaxis protein CheR [Melioribacteraceae bacterium]|nr:MAG: chemotaxis protein CheR [Melioribacteraceae bacterium]